MGHLRRLGGTEKIEAQHGTGDSGEGEGEGTTPFLLSPGVKRPETSGSAQTHGEELAGKRAFYSHEGTEMLNRVKLQDNQTGEVAMETNGFNT